MAEITQNQIEEIYQLFCDFKSNKITRQQVILQSSMNANSAKDYLRNLKRMTAGLPYTRSMQNQATDFFLESIYRDFSNVEFENALTSVDEFIEYYEDKHQSNLTLRRLREILIKHRCKSELINIEQENRREEEEQQRFIEGKSTEITLNRFERSQKARKACIEHYGSSCQVCGIDFNDRYGVFADSYIQVHHVVEISSRLDEYQVDPIEDLVPVCPNCHSMLHRKKPAYSICEMRVFLGDSCKK